MLNHTIISVIGLMAALLNTSAQETSFVGMTKEMVKEKMEIQSRDFYQDQSIVKQQFNYLKYVNRIQTITWIFYFTDDDVCRATKKVCDYSEYDFVLDELNEKYESVGDFIWEYTTGSETYTITLEEEDWYFTLREVIKEE
ncbi:MAG TPA: hypothetical protein VJ951_03425 [Bacteroidales bacterium]|nr:hypothetical protein [Bacteroidales bacterium]